MPNTTIITPEEIIDPSKENLEELLTQFNDVKASSSKSFSSLDDSMTISGMDEVNELVSGAMKQIQSFVENGKEKTRTEKVTSRALALTGLKDTWADKWLNKTKDKAEEDKYKNKTINQIVDTLIEQIMIKREEVISGIKTTTNIKISMLEDQKTYIKLLEQTEGFIATLPSTESAEALDAEFLASMLRTSIKNLSDSISSQVNPLITGANILCRQVQAVIPTLETELRQSGRFKSFQQKSSDLAGMVKTTIALATETGDIIRKDINETIYTSIAMLAETGVDPKRQFKIQEEQKAHQIKVNQVMTQTQAKIQETFDYSKKLYSAIEDKKDNPHVLLQAYSKIGE
jgi:hypothetical protein